MAKSETKSERKVKPVDGVEVKWTKNAKFHETGTTSIVHKVQAEKLVKSNMAELVKDGKTETKPITGEGGVNV